MKAIYFDMDGTIADLYGYEGWLDMLHNEDTTPYEDCGVLVDLEEMHKVLNEFIALGVTIGIISWGAMDGSREYCKRTRKAKIAWCEKYFPNIFTEYHVVKYGTPKHHVRNIKDSILVDDNANVREAWKGETVDATKDIISILRQLLATYKCENQKYNWNHYKDKWECAREEGLFSELFNQHWTTERGLYMLGQSSRNPVTKEERYWIKIGLTDNATARFDSYLTHSADIYFIDWYPIKRKNRLHDNECFCHAQLLQMAKKRRTEWFQVSEKFYFEMCAKGFSNLILLD